jgi:predicted Zn-dependent peptidase
MVTITVRYSHLAPEHKVQALLKLEERFKNAETEAEKAVVSEEIRSAIDQNFAGLGTKPERFPGKGRAAD